MDLRIPIGLFFSVVSAILLLTAVFGDKAGASVNGFCGGVMAVFGMVMLWLARRRA